MCVRVCVFWFVFCFFFPSPPLSFLWQLTNNLHNRTLLYALMKMAHCLLMSRFLHVEPYLHQLVPSILTCLVGPRLCVEATEDHWQVRDTAADLVRLVCVQYGHMYKQLQARITRKLLQAWLDPHKSLNTHYGCIIGLARLGHACVKTLVIPYVAAYFDVLSE